MKNLNTKILATIVLTAVSFTGIASTYAADGDYKPNRAMWNSDTNEIAYYSMYDFGEALQKNDLKTALEALDYHIKELIAERIDKYDDEAIEDLKFYRKELAKRVLHEDLIMRIPANVRDAFEYFYYGVKNGQFSGYGFKIAIIDGSGNEKDGHEEDNYTTTTVNTNTSSNNTSVVNNTNSNTSTTKKVKVKEVNKYKHLVPSYETYKFLNYERQIEQIVSITLKERYKNNQKAAVEYVAGVNERAGKILNSGRNIPVLIKAVVEEVRISLNYHLID